ncbi:nucleoside-diphosphate sugar epimerase/dehydratase [Aurantivibrio infirmus]
MVLLLKAKAETSKHREPIIIYGAGHGGFQLANALQGSKYKVAGFVDDNPRIRGTIMRGLKVSNPKKLPRLVKTFGVKHILLALGNAPRSKRSSIIKQLEALEISVKTIPDMNDILAGKSKIEDIRDVDVEDLLGRDQVMPVPMLLSACITNKNVFVSGAGGSIGSELCRQILKQSPTRLVLFELNEYNLYKAEAELTEIIASHGYQIELVSILGSAQNKSQLKRVFESYNINTIYHAAAYKHVPLIEKNIIEGVKNNVLGTWFCALAAIDANVDSFVLISTDKAVRPSNVMGASKRLAELSLQALAENQKVTRFTMVRFGNVLGSSGSVVPLFRKQIHNGGPVTVTHPEITRYFMTIPEAAELVLQAGSIGTGGDVFVLDMGQPVKIVDLAKRMIQLSGLSLKDESNENGDIEVKFSGLRPGEKLFEELLIGKNVTSTSHPRILRAEEKHLKYSEIKIILEDLEKSCRQQKRSEVELLLLKAPLDYKSPSTNTSNIVQYSDAKVQLR